ncbi:MAG: hypothetical protein IIZ43_04195 [Eubacterium sp.]|nr:hypothetical protein [Eubacterium sp.]
MLKGTTRARTWRAIYRLLDRVSPVDYDCGRLCGSICCGRIEDDMGIYLLPGEEKIHSRKETWLSWSEERAEDYEFPDSWKGKVYYVKCMEPPHCPREQRPLQCRTFPLLPHLTEDGELILLYNDMDLPYRCPLIEEEIPLEERFVQATQTVWEHLIRDPLIYDLVWMDSRAREEAAMELAEMLI